MHTCEACETLEKAIDLNPASIEAYKLLGMYHIIVGKKDKAVQLLEQADQIDPLSPAITLTLGSMYAFAYRFDEAIKQAEKLLEMNPQMRGALELKAWCVGMQGNWREALPLFVEVHELTNHPLKGLMGLAYTYGILGERKKAMECIEKMEQRQREEPHAVIDPDLAGAWVGSGDFEKAFYYLNQCLDKRVGPVSYFIQYPPFEVIKNDPRYEELKERMKLP